MKIVEISYPFDPKTIDLVKSSLAIGFFDGLHLGHQAVIKQAIKKADELQIIPAVMTFSPHPREVLGKKTFTGYLTPLKEKLRQLDNLGIKRAYVVTFDPSFAHLEKEKFITDVLLPLQVTAVTTGFNFTFGHRGMGTAADLVQLSKGFFDVQIVDPIILDDIAVSSTRTREALSKGNVQMAHELLGRPYRMEGGVVHGDKRGRQIGFPTANIKPDHPYYIPAHGVYVVRAVYTGKIAYGVMNVGVRPTFDKSHSETKLEVHLLDQPNSLNIYGETVQVELLHYLRNEVKFSSVESLIEQIKLDERQTIEWISKSKVDYEPQNNLVSN